MFRMYCRTSTYQRKLNGAKTDAVRNIHSSIARWIAHQTVRPSILPGAAWHCQALDARQREAYQLELPISVKTDEVSHQILIAEAERVILWGPRLVSMLLLNGRSLFLELLLP